MSSHETIDERWAYNCEDTVRTLECADQELSILKKFNLESVNQMQQDMIAPVLHAMIRGVKIDLKAREDMRIELEVELLKRQYFFKQVLGHDLNPRSPKQMMALFYEDLQQRVIFTRAKKGVPSRPTLNDDALETLGNREPLLKPIIKNIQEYRSIGVYKGTFVEAELDVDDRMRCSYNICGAETYRLSSSENAFGSGTNLQNVPPGSQGKEEGDLSLPNIRKIFVPDSGCTFFDADLDRADLQVVVWEAQDQEMKRMLKEGVDVHTENAKTLHCNRQMAKIWVHGTNYGGSPRTMAINCGLTQKDAEAMQKRWFEAHPGIKKWHERTAAFLQTRRYVENRYGYRRFYFGRIEALLPEALAWVPQSTVAITINRAWLNIFRNVPQAEVLLQVHDSLCGQFPTSDSAAILPLLRQAALVTIPYPDPLVIPIGFKTSTESWGMCK